MPLHLIDVKDSFTPSSGPRLGRRQDREQRITELTARLGGPQANISAQLTRLKQSGLITSRTQGRAVYYRLTQPELGALLKAAGQLSAPARQQATEEDDKTARKTQPTN